MSLDPPPSVLLVDDDAIVRGSLRALLEDGGCAVVGEASHGGEAVDLTAELRPEVVVMDVRMPHVDGIEATRRITEMVGSAVRVVVLSAYEDPAFRRDAARAGAFAYLVKGRAASEVVDTVADACRDLRGVGPGGS